MQRTGRVPQSSDDGQNCWLPINRERNTADSKTANSPGKHTVDSIAWAHAAHTRLPAVAFQPPSGSAVVNSLHASMVPAGIPAENTQNVTRQAKCHQTTKNKPNRTTHVWIDLNPQCKGWHLGPRLVAVRMSRYKGQCRAQKCMY